MIDLLMFLALQEEAERLTREIRKDFAGEGEDEEAKKESGIKYPLNHMCGLTEMNGACVFCDNYCECCKKQTCEGACSKDWREKRAENVKQFVKNKEYDKLSGRELFELCQERFIMCEPSKSKQHYIKLIKGYDECYDDKKKTKDKLDVIGRYVIVNIAEKEGSNTLDDIYERMMYIVDDKELFKNEKPNTLLCMNEDDFKVLFNVVKDLRDGEKGKGDVCNGSARVDSLSTNSFINSVKSAIRNAEHNGEDGAIFTISAMKKVVNEMQKLQDLMKVLADCKYEFMKRFEDDAENK